MKPVLGIGAGAAALAASMALALWRVPAANRPQAARGDDVLAVTLGDARQTLSSAFVHLADSYFHGGVDMDGGHECELHHDHDHDHGEAATSAPTAEVVSRYDLWRWINTRIRAPQVERHLEGEKAVEMIPLLWAGVRADPKNIDAWTTAWYVATCTMRNPELGKRILDEAMRQNPDEPELIFTQARVVYDGGKGDRAAAKALMLRARQLLLARCGGDLEKLKPDDKDTLRHIDMFANHL